MNDFYNFSMNAQNKGREKFEDGIGIDGFFVEVNSRKNNINDDLTHRHRFEPTSFVSSRNTAKLREANYIE